MSPYKFRQENDMAQVSENIRDGQRVITFEGPKVDALRGLDGVCSHASWSNDDMMPALRQLFHCQPEERIVAIVVDNFGISAKIERR